MASNALVLQCGGPTPVINASLCGVMSGCQRSPEIDQLWGARHGIKGLLSGDWIDLAAYQSAPEWLARLEQQPGAVLESGRDRLDDEAISETLERLRQRQIRAVFLIGGNGSMQAAQALGESARASGYRVGDQPLQVIAIPKTIDNDIPATAVCPGYGSAARFVAQSVHDVSLDLYAMRDFDDVAVIEVMGRHAGWLAAAGALARWDEAAPPHLILLPEVPFDEEAFLDAVRCQHERERMCVVVAAEGIRDKQGRFLVERHRTLDRDVSGQKLFGLAGGPSPHLAALINVRLGLRCRQMRPDLIQRSNSATTSSVDRALARQVGEDAVQTALDGHSEVMIALERCGSAWRSVPVALERVMGNERTLPSEFIAPTGFDVTKDFLDYARPLIGEWRPGAIRL